MNVEERFWSKVDRSGGDESCWPWTGSRDALGYGLFSLGGHTRRAHRVSYLLSRGHWPTDCCCHSCDVRACVNPRHLWVGSRADNAHDRERKLRQARGERMGSAKLTADDVRVIRVMVSEIGQPYATAARWFGVSDRSISNIIRGRTWRHIGEEAA